MKINEKYVPEGKRSSVSKGDADVLRQAMLGGDILEATAHSCSAAHELLISLDAVQGIIPREECALGIADGSTREIAILSRVGKPVCFRVLRVDDANVLLSRRLAQQEALDWFMENLRCGDTIPARVTHMESFGVFADIGCGVAALLGIENLSVSRIFHPSERFSIGQDIYAVVLHIDYKLRRVTLSHRELLGTWAENAALFAPGETVQGIVRSIESYGIFIELTPNLSGLAERREGIYPGQAVSVYIKSIMPERMKIKLAIIDVLGQATELPMPRYFLPEERLSSWVYTPASCQSKYIATSFDE